MRRFLPGSPIPAHMTLAVVLLVVLVNGLVWSWAIPFDGAPDEVHKYDVAYFIARYHRIPTFGPQPGADLYIRSAPGTRDQYVYDIAAIYPSGPYLLSAALMCLDPARDPRTLLRLARLASVLCNTLTAYLAYRILATLSRSNRYALSLTAFLAFIPQVTYVGAYVGDDAYTIMATTWSIWALVRGLTTGWTPGNRWMMGLALAFTMLGKQNGWVAALPFAGIALWSARQRALSGRLCAWLSIGSLPSLTLGSWLLRNRILYGDWTALGIARMAWQDFVARLDPATQPLPITGSSLDNLLIRLPWLQWTFESFWGRFYYMDVRLPEMIYTILAIGCGVGIISTLWVVAQSVMHRAAPFAQPFAGPILIGALVAFIFLLAANIWTNIYNDFQAQGRYFFPLLVPIGVALTLGLFKLQTNHPRAAMATWGIVLAALVTLNVFALYIVYTHPFPTIPLPNS